MSKSDLSSAILKHLERETNAHAQRFLRPVSADPDNPITFMPLMYRCRSLLRRGESDSLPSVPRALSFLFSPGCSRLLFTSPHFPVRTKKKQRPLRRRESLSLNALAFWREKKTSPGVSAWCPRYGHFEDNYLKNCKVKVLIYFCPTYNTTLVLSDGPLEITGIFSPPLRRGYT